RPSACPSVFPVRPRGNGVTGILQSGRLDSNQRSRASEARDHSRLVHVPPWGIPLPEHPAGVEPASPGYGPGQFPITTWVLGLSPSYQRALNFNGTRGARTLTSLV